MPQRDPLVIVGAIWVVQVEIVTPSVTAERFVPENVMVADPVAIQLITAVYVVPLDVLLISVPLPLVTTQ